MAKIVQLQNPRTPRTTVGQMRQQVKVLNYADTPFGSHSLSREYIEVAIVRARVTNISGSSSREGKGLDANITHTVVIRTPEFEVTTENMLEWVHPGTNEYLRIRQARPVGRTEKDPRQQFLMLLCESQGLVESFKSPSPEQPLP